MQEFECVTYNATNAHDIVPKSYCDPGIQNLGASIKRSGQVKSVF